MQNEDLIQLLEKLDPDKEICVETYECISEKFEDSTYVVDYGLNEYKQLILQMDLERANLNLFDFISSLSVGGNFL